MLLLQDVIELSKITKLHGMHRTLGAAHALLLSRCERVIQFVFDSFRILFFHRLFFHWQVAFPQSCGLLPPCE